MIAASEPLEFIPLGRQAVEEHPGPTEANKQTHLSTEHILLQRMQNVNISEHEEHNEYWCIREIYEPCNKNKQNQNSQTGSAAAHKQKKTKIEFTPKNRKSKDGESKEHPTRPNQEYMCEYFVNSEEELYVKKYTAVWTRGMAQERSILPRLCFTCETPIKYAFFCSNEFVRARKENEKADDENALTSICLIDQNSLRVYCSDGEDFLTNLEFPVSHVWPTYFGILLEKVASNAVIQNHTISMPRLFSLSHPLDEICPVLNKSANNKISYLIESDYNIIFSSEQSDLLLLYDNKIGKHFISRLRKATDEEIQYVGAQNETALSGSVHQSILRGGHGILGSLGNFSLNSMKTTGTTPKNCSTTTMARGSLGNTNYSTHISKFLTSAHSMSAGFGNLKNSTASPLNNLQTTIGHNSISMYDMRKVGQSQPSKPIVPQFCLERIWTENTYGSNRGDFCEISSRAFIHTDLVGQTYLCYLLPRSSKLRLVSLGNYGECDLQITSIPASLPAKDAVCLERMKMIVVLDPSGSLILYTGAVLVSKVYVSPSLLPTSATSTVTPMPAPSSNAPEVGAAAAYYGKSPHTLNTSFPRRSSLLPTAQKPTDNTFEDELHLLSPVPPLQPQFPNRNNNNVCLGLRDPAGNRLTLLYSNGKMYRIALPLMNETKFISRCIDALRQILTRDQFIQLITRWYGTRNPPGSRDYSIEQEWQIFRNVLIDLMGCTMHTHESSVHTTASFNAEEPKKRRKNDEINVGSEDDWQFMLSVLQMNNDQASSESKQQQQEQPQTSNSNQIDTSACLFATIPAIFYGLHLLYEDFKLDESLHDYLPHLAEFLHQLAIDMQLQSYIFHYGMDFPKLLYHNEKCCPLTEQHGAQMQHQELLQVPAPSVYRQIEHVLLGREDVLQYAYVTSINVLSRNVLQLISLIKHGHEKIKQWIKPLEFTDSVQANYPKQPKRFISINVPRSEQLIQMLINMEMTRIDVSNLPVALHLIIAECLEQSRLSPPIGCTPATYELILRSELVEHAKIPIDSFRYPLKSNVDIEDSLSARCPPSTNGISHMDAALDDGMDNIDTKLLSLRFPDDMRIAEVRRLLTSSEPVLIDITQSPGTSDHEFIEEQEKQLFALCTRTMSLPMGRGMFTLRTSIPTPTESMPIPKLCLTGREPVKGATIEMQQVEFPATMSTWPTFHNGVAAGLKISPFARDVDSTWIVYNKPKGQAEISTEHAGFLMALGLNGHLKTLSFMSIYEYLVKCDEMTSVGLLLGISATHRGTMDNTTTKLLSVHIEALLPATALELDIPQNIQVASLMGIGLIFAGTAKRHIAEVLLQEVGRPPGPEMENSIERESYALTAGLALGLVTLGQGESPAGLRDLQLPDTLHYYMVGGNKRLLTGSQKEKYKLPSFQVREGENVNIDVTAPGATLALGLMFFNTDNRAVAEWMNPPNTRYLLDLVRPDLLLLRTIARGLILWSEIQPTEEWLHSQFPSNLQFDVERGAAANDVTDDVDHEAITQAYCNIISGAAFCIGLKYAGTENPEAFKSLRGAIKMFMGFPNKYVGEFAGRTTVESSLMLILISISLVFAGSGNLDILRIVRHLRSRIGSQHLHVTYGSHMAMHMSLGLLYLGAGRFSIAKTPEAVAALVCAFFPKFPNHSNDNRYHLQAFRHLYVLAVEPRLFLPRDIDTKKLCLCNISVLEVGSNEMRKLPMAPCLLPELSTLQKVVVDDPNYWPVSFEKNRNWDQLVKALENSACIDIKKRSGCLSHLEDPDRLKSLLAQTLTSEQYLCWDVDPKTLELFSNEPYVISFTDRFLHLDTEETSETEITRAQQLIALFYNAVIKDKMHVLPIYLAIFDHVNRLKVTPKCTDLWQIKLIDLYVQRSRGEHALFSEELVQSQVEQFKLYIENALEVLSAPLKRFISATHFDTSIVQALSEFEVTQFIAVVNFYNLTPNLLNMVTLDYSNFDFFDYMLEMCKLNLDSTTVFGILKILQSESSKVENDA